jgi:hypothetical protein
MNKKFTALTAVIICFIMSVQVFASQLDYVATSGTLTLNKVYNGVNYLSKTVSDISGEVLLTASDTIDVDGEAKQFSYFEYVTNNGTSIASYSNPFKFYSTGDMCVNAVYGEDVSQKSTEKSNGYFKDSVTENGKIYYFINTVGDYGSKYIEGANSDVYAISDTSGYTDGDAGQYITAIPKSFNTTWDFTKVSADSATTVTENYVSGLLTVYASTDKKVSFDKYGLNLGGSSSSGNPRSIELKVKGNYELTVYALNKGDTARPLAVKENNTETTTSMPASASSSSTITVSKTDKSETDISTIQIYSKNSGLYIEKIELTADNSGVFKEASDDNSNTDTDDGDDDEGLVLTATTVSELASAVATLKNSDEGGTVYVSDDLEFSDQLALSSTADKPVKIVGKQKEDGTYPVLNFEGLRDTLVGSTGESLKSSTDTGVGVRITGSRYTLKNLIIEKAGDNGVQIKGSNANYNTVENCIIRYNNDAGLQITDGASNNTIKYVFSYRNCDVYTRGGNADGFAPKLGATTGNTFYGCCAWDNSDDAWDSFDKTDSGYTLDLSYEYCSAWNNGNPKVFTGEYDLENGNSLDKNLFLVQLMIKQDNSFESDYQSGKIDLSKYNINTKSDSSSAIISAKDWAGSKYDGNPNGFKFGSINTGSDCVRTVKNCLSFNHEKKGFDNNNSSCTASLENCVSFDNGYNYYIPPFTITGWENIIGFGGKNSDSLPSGCTVSKATNESEIRTKVEATRKEIVEKCNSNIIPVGVTFDIFG